LRRKWERIVEKMVSDSRIKKRGTKVREVTPGKRGE
jgi:hypothetical protein